MPEVVIGRSVLIVVGERDAGYNQVHRITFHSLTFKNIVVIYGPPKFTGLFFPAGKHPPHHLLLCLQAEQTVLADYIGHLGYHLAVLRPLLHEALVYLSLTFRIDQIKVNRMLLHETVDTGYRLELVVKTVVNEHDCLMAVVLEVQTFTKHLRFGGQIFQTTVFEIRYHLVRFIIILRAVHSLTSGYGITQSLPFILQVMP